MHSRSTKCVLLTLIAIGLLRSAVVEATGVNLKKGSITSTHATYSDSSLLLRNRRQASFEGDYDDNIDIIPELSAPPHKRLEDELSERADKIAADFKAMYETFADALQRCFDAIRSFFSCDDGTADEQLDHSANNVYE